MTRKCSGDIYWNAGKISVIEEQIQRDEREIRYLEAQENRLRRDNQAMGSSEQEESA